MKKIYIAFFISILSLTLASCERDFLEPWPPDAARQAEDIWGNYYYSKGVMDRVYTGEGIANYWNEVYGGGTAPARNGGMASACDEAEHSGQSDYVQRFTNGSWNVTNTPTTYYGSQYNGHNARSPWINSYLGMRRLHLFLANCDNSVLIDDPDDPTRAHDLTYWKGQAHWWRAWLGFDILRRYGGYPISLVVEEINDELYRGRNTIDECVAQILYDCNAAIDSLPVLWDEANWGRVNRMHAMALKSRLLLYYASPLYQGDFETFGNPAGTVGEVQRWIDAADAAREAINQNDFYNLMPVTTYKRPYSAVGTYSYQIGLTGNLENTELIFSTGFGTSYSIHNERGNLPDGVEGCYGYTNPTQELVDQFEYVTGTGANRKAEIIPLAEFIEKNPGKSPFDNRDTRFYNSINYNGYLWGETSSKSWTVYTYEPVTIGDKSYPAGIHRDRTRLNATKTGYYMRKFLSEQVYAYKSGQYTTPARGRHEIRFAELILNYAEALNEAYGPETPDPNGELRDILETPGINTARAAINIIRARVNMPPVAAGMSQAEMREVIHHERQIELCFEGHRFYDVRRWKEGEKLGGTIHGIKITPTEFNAKGVPTKYTYEVEEVETRVWKDCYYWYPIPYAELVKYAGKGPDGTNSMKQNPGWK